MSVEFKKNGSGKCPVAHGAMSKNSQSTTEEWWPKNLKLDILHPVSYTHLTLPTILLV